MKSMLLALCAALLLAAGARAQTTSPLKIVLVCGIATDGSFGCLPVSALPPGPQGAQGPQGVAGATGATGAKGDKGDAGPAITGQACSVPDGAAPTLMVKLADGSCLPIIVVSPTVNAQADGTPDPSGEKTAWAVLDGFSVYSPSGWQLAGVVLPTPPATPAIPTTHPAQ